MELVRKLILKIEAHPHGHAPRPLEIEGYDDETIGYHCYLIAEAGLADGKEDILLSLVDSPKVIISSLTPGSHDFAVAAREDSRSAKAMAIVKEKGGSITIDILKDLLLRLMMSSFGL
jgi:hypothetical protein